VFFDLSPNFSQAPVPIILAGPANERDLRLTVDPIDRQATVVTIANHQAIAGLTNPWIVPIYPRPCGWLIEWRIVNDIETFKTRYFEPALANFFAVKVAHRLDDLNRGLAGLLKPVRESPFKLSTSQA